MACIVSVCFVDTIDRSFISRNLSSFQMTWELPSTLRRDSNRKITKCSRHEKLLSYECRLRMASASAFQTYKTWNRCKLWRESGRLSGVRAYEPLHLNIVLGMWVVNDCYFSMWKWKRSYSLYGRLDSNLLNQNFYGRVRENVMKQVHVHICKKVSWLQAT